MCNTSPGNNDYDFFSGREKELIQKLEEATDEIESLLVENDKLSRLSNGLRFELNKTKPSSSSLTTRSVDSEPLANEQTMLDAILNDQSRSCESERSRDYEEVACIGRKPPLVSVTNSRPSKTAYVRTTLSLCRIFSIFTRLD